MFGFQKSSAKLLGRVDVLDLAIVEGQRVERCPGRPGHDVYFLIRITYDSNGEYCFEKLPTGILPAPYIASPDEMLLTDGEEYWEIARHLTPEQLLELGKPCDHNLWILDESELPERVQKLTIADRDHILAKIEKYCNEASGDGTDGTGKTTGL